MINRLWNKIRHKAQKESGQTITELAIFAPIFLLCLTMLIQYGLSLNYQLQQKQEAFRKAMAYATGGSVNARQGQYASYQHVPFVDAQDEIGVPQHYPVGASASVTWTNRLAGAIQWNNDDDLPRVFYEIDNALYPPEGLKIAGFGWRRDIALTDTVKIKKDRDDGTWYWETVPLSWEVKKTTFQDLNYVMWDVINGTRPNLDYGTMADVDNDNKEEMIISTVTHEGDETTNSDGDTVRTDNISEIKYIDYQSGDIDLTINSSDENMGYKVQGVQPGYERQFNMNASLAKQENVPSVNPDAIVSTTKIKANEQVKFKFIDKEGTHSIETQYPTDRTVTWTTPNN